MLAIKLKPIGKKHQRSFRVVIAEKRSKLKGKFIEDIGWMNPHSDAFEIDKERAERWLGFGAKPTASVYNLFVKAGILRGPKIPVHAKSKKKKTEESGGASEAKEFVANSAESQKGEAGGIPEEKEDNTNSIEQGKEAAAPADSASEKSTIKTEKEES